MLLLLRMGLTGVPQDAIQYELVPDGGVLVISCTAFVLWGAQAQGQWQVHSLGFRQLEQTVLVVRPLRHGWGIRTEGY
jgi:hypothetical protein